MVRDKQLRNCTPRRPRLGKAVVQRRDGCIGNDVVVVVVMMVTVVVVVVVVVVEERHTQHGRSKGSDGGS